MHIQLGGSVNDNVGKQLVQEFIIIALKSSEVARISSTYNLKADDLALLYGNGIQKLMPNPCVSDGGPVQIPNRVGSLFAATLFFMEPWRLEAMAKEIDFKVRNGGPAIVSFTNEEGTTITHETDGSQLGRILAIGEVSQREALHARQIHDQTFGPAKFFIEQHGGLKSAKGCLVIIGTLIAFTSAVSYLLQS